MTDAAFPPVRQEDEYVSLSSMQCLEIKSCCWVLRRLGYVPGGNKLEAEPASEAISKGLPRWEGDRNNLFSHLVSM